jgi:hypothetical protein
MIKKNKEMIKKEKTLIINLLHFKKKEIK